MCEVTTAVMIAGALFSGYSAYQQGQNAQKEAEYKAEVANANAKVSEAQAVDAENRGANSAATMRENYLKANATARAAAASAGLLTNSGTMEKIQEQNVETGEMDVLTTRNNAAREAWGYRSQSADYKNQASASIYEGKSAAQAGLLTGVGKFAEGATKAAGQSKWLKKQFDE